MDINTIFYFPNSLTFEEYTEMLAGGDIAPRTIVFADAQKSIYKDGKKYGDISEQKFRDLLDAVKNNSWISDELDGIKGDIIRNRDALNNLDNLTDQLIQGIQSDITDANQRISSLNDSISTVNSNLNAAISNRDAAIQTKVENLFDDTEWLSENFPQGQTNWDSRWDSDLESYLLTVGYWDVDEETGEKTTKWSQLQSSVDSISSSVNDLKVNGNLTQAMTSSIESLISDDITALNLGTTYATIASVDDVEKIVEWFYSGITSSSQADKTVAQMSAMSKNDFIAAISDIRTQVDKVANGDFVASTEVYSKVGDTITNMLLQSSSDNALSALSAKANANSDNISALILGMTGSTSTANLSTNVSNALNNLTSGLISSADATSAINSAKTEIYSNIGAKDSSDNFITLSSLKVLTDKLENGDYVAEADLSTKVGDTISAMLLQSSSDNALASMSAKLDTVELQSDATAQNVADLILGVTGSSSTANISTAVSNVLSGFATSSDVTDDITTAKNEIYSAIGAKDTNDLFISIATLKTQVDEYSSQISGLASTNDVSAGFVAKADLDSAVASLVAQNGSSVKANIGTAVTNGISAATISANQIILEGLVTANNNFKIKSDGSMETIAGKIGGFNITSSSIYNGTTSLSDTTNGGVYVGTDGIRCNGTVSSDVWSGGITTNNLTASNIYIRPNMIYNDGLGNLSCNNLFAIDNLGKDSLGETYIYISRKTGGTTTQDHTENSVSIKPSEIHFIGSSYSSQMTSSSISITGSSSSASMDSDKLQVLSGGYGSYVGSSKIEYSYGLSVEMLNHSTANADCAVTIDNNGFIITGPAPSPAQSGSTPTLMDVAKISKDGDATFLNLYSRELYIREYLLDITAAVNAGILVEV